MKYLSLCIPGNDGAIDCIDAPGNVPTGNRGETLETILQTGITIFIIGVTFIALFYLVWSGIRWITSGGDKQRIQSARMGIIYSLIGLLIIFLSFFIIMIIGQFVGAQLIQLPLTPPPSCGPGDPGPC